MADVNTQSMQELLQEALVGIQPLLTASGRTVHIKDVSDARCVIELSGFCDGCACSESYKEGISDLIRERAPSIKDIEFIQL